MCLGWEARLAAGRSRQAHSIPNRFRKGPIMSRVSGRVLWTVAAMATFVAIAQVADAQQGQGRRGGGRGFGGRGGGFGVSSIQLAAESPEVQEALKLTDDQKTKVGEINDKLRDDRRELFQGGGGG